MGAAENDIVKLCNILQDYRTENIFNMDELGLFYRAISNYS